MEILNSVGGFVLQALPTIVLILLFYFFLKTQLFKPLEKVMAERSARIEGARKTAEASQAAAQEKVRAYQDALKKARTEVYAEQETARRAVLEERSALVKSARARANEEVVAAKKKIAGELATARIQLEKESDALGSEIARAILQRRPSGPMAGRGAQ